jgi:hypothetical protein
VTVIRVSAFAVPPGPVARAVYVVELPGDTLRLPEGSTVPIPPSIVTLVAFLAFHESVDDWPFSMVEGEAESEIVGAAGAGAGGGASIFAAGGGGVTFFLQPLPASAMLTRTNVRMASVYTDFLMRIRPPSNAERGFSLFASVKQFRCFFRLTVVVRAEKSI